MKLTIDTLDVLASRYLTLDEAAHLYFKAFENYATDISASSRDKLINLGYLDKLGLTDKSFEILKILEPDKILVAGLDEDFNNFWQQYPEWDDPVTPTRNLKANKKQARIEYDKAVSEGNSPELILRSLTNQVHFNIRTNGNLKYFKGAVNFLAKFSPWEENLPTLKGGNLA